jgi:aryl-alcohol dehydrogenase-like predicted oxidoreductase
MNTRRNFLRSMAGLTAGLMVPLNWSCKGTNMNRDRFGELLPLRKLGRTGEKVTMLGVGGYHIGWTTERDAQEVIETAIEGGIRFFDTAHNYGKGKSEERYGKFLVPDYRDHVFLMTKTQAPDAKTLLEEVELSLQRLNTEQVDLLQLHSFKTPEDVDLREQHGVMDAITQIKEEGKARFIGFTGHRNPYAHLRMMEKLERYPDFATLQMPLNIVDYASDHSFIRETLTPAVEHELGILAMKTLADGRFFHHKQVNDRVLWDTEDPVIPGHVSVREALFFSWSLPIGVLITGAENKDLLVEKIDLAREFSKLSEEDKDLLLDKVSGAPELGSVEYYKRIDTLGRNQVNEPGQGWSPL